MARQPKKKQPHPTPGSLNGGSTAGKDDQGEGYLSVPEKKAAAATERPSQLEVLRGVAARATYFHTPEREAFARAKEPPYATMAVGSSAFRDWLISRCFLEMDLVPGELALKNCIRWCEAQARVAGYCRKVWSRVGGDQLGQTIYLDVGNETWSAIKITAASVMPTMPSPVPFRRPPTILPLPWPEKGGSVEELKNFVNVRPEEFPLLVGWLLAALRPRGPYPVLALYGRHGSAKSSTARFIRSLIDPDLQPLQSEPVSLRDLAVSAGEGWVMAFDNLSEVNPRMSDLLCMMSTGGHMSVRGLYTNKEKCVLPLSNPLILTSIEEIASRGDLLDRALILTLPEIPDEKRAREADLWAKFEEARPRILGALLAAVSMALLRFPSLTLKSTSRMADFEAWVCAAEPALPWKPGTLRSRSKPTSSGRRS